MNKSLKPHLNPGEYVFVLTDNIYGINEEDILCSFKEDGKYSLILKKELQINMVCHMTLLLLGYH